MTDKLHPALDPSAKLPPRPMALILAEVADKHGFTVHAIKGRSRKSAISIARQEFCYRAVNETSQSLPAIGNFIGGRDHTTVIYGVTQHAIRHGLEMPRGMVPLSRASARQKCAAHGENALAMLVAMRVASIRKVLAAGRIDRAKGMLTSLQSEVLRGMDTGA